MPIAHVGVRVANLKNASSFYLQALAPLHYAVFKEIDGVVVGLHPKYGAPDFWIHESPEAKEGIAAKIHVAFCVSSRRTVDAFHKAALKAGGTCNGPPGERPHYVKGYYAAYVLDPDGNNIECMYWQPLWLMVLQKAPVIAGLVAVGVAWWAGKSGWMTG